MAFISSVPLFQTGASCSSVCKKQRHVHVNINKRALSTIAMCASTTETGSSTHAESLSETWPAFAEKMKSSGEIPELEEWHKLLDGCIRANDKPGSGVWLINLMRETGQKPTAVTYEKVLHICKTHDDRVAAFHLVEHMYKDKVLLGDVELPDGMEDTLRNILPPDAFE